MRRATRRVSTVVLPDPAAATTHNGALVRPTASRWDGVNPRHSAAGSGPPPVSLAIDGDRTEGV
jgi:hypothetical protein